MDDRVYLGSVLLKNIEGTFSDAELDELISRNGNVRLAQAAAYGLEASRVMFSFSAGDVSVDKSKYAANLIKLSEQIKADASGGEISSVVSWSSTDEFGTAGVRDYIDEEYNDNAGF